MKSELLSPDTLTQELKNRRLELLNLLNLKTKAQKNLPQGHLRIEQKKGLRAPHFYHFTNPADTHGEYIPAFCADLARRLAQKDYDNKLIKLLEQQLKLIEKLILATENKITGLYTKSSPTRQKLITPVTLTDQQYIQHWQNITWQPLPFAADSPEFFTSRGEQVRSKSEVIIANMLYENHIPYTYEKELDVGGYKKIPDFTIEDEESGDVWYWEHCGMMNDENYSKRWNAKEKLYAANGIVEGKNLIVTKEYGMGFDSSEVKAIIEKLFK